MIDKPKTPLDRQSNKDTLQLAKSIKAKRELEIKNGLYGFENEFKQSTNFVDYFIEQTEKRKESAGNYGIWDSTLKHIIRFAGTKISFKEIDQDFCENFRDYLSIPVINGLSPSSHPTQVLSDVFTVEEIKKKPISKLNICWIGDSNNVLDSLIAASVKFSFKLSIGCPKKFEPGKEVQAWVKKNNKKIFIYNDPKKAVVGADVIFSDKVISLNDKGNKKKKIDSTY